MRFSLALSAATLLTLAAGAAPSSDPLLSVFLDGLSLPGLGPVDNVDAVVFHATGSEPGGTTGAYLSDDLFWHPPGLTGALNPNIDGLHYVVSDLTLTFNPAGAGPPGGLVPAGSVLVSFDINGVFVPGPVGQISVNDEDIALFIPTTVGDLSTGEWYTFFDGQDLALSDAGGNGDIDGLALVEKTVSVGGMTFLPGDLLISFLGPNSPSGTAAAPSDVMLFRPTAYGDNTAPASWGNSGLPIFRGFQVGLTTSPVNENVTGVHLIEEARQVGDAEVAAGSLLLTIAQDSTSVGAPVAITAGNEDALVFTPTSLGSPPTGTTAGSFAVLLDGAASDMALGTNAVDALALVPAPAFTAGLLASDETNGPPLMSGDIITYTLDVTSVAPRGATGVSVSGEIPAETGNLAVLSTGGGVDFSAGTTLDIRDIPVGALATAQIQWQVQVSPGVPEAVPIAMTADISAARQGGQPTSAPSNELYTIPAELTYFGPE